MKRTLLPIFLGISIALTLFSFAGIIYFRPKEQLAARFQVAAVPQEPVVTEQPTVAPTPEAVISSAPVPVETKQPPAPPASIIQQALPEPTVVSQPVFVPTVNVVEPQQPIPVQPEPPVVETVAPPAQPVVAAEPATPIAKAEVIEEPTVVAQVPMAQPVVEVQPALAEVPPAPPVVESVPVAEPIIAPPAVEPVAVVAAFVPKSTLYPRLEPLASLIRKLSAAVPKKAPQPVVSEVIVAAEPIAVVAEPVAVAEVVPAAPEVEPFVAKSTLYPKTEPLASLLEKRSAAVPKKVEQPVIEPQPVEIPVVAEVPKAFVPESRLYPRVTPLSALAAQLAGIAKTQGKVSGEASDELSPLWSTPEPVAPSETPLYFDPVSYLDTAAQLRQEAVDKILSQLSIPVWE